MKLFNFLKKKKKTKIEKDFNFDENIINELKPNDLANFGVSEDWRKIDLEFYLKYINYITAIKLSTEDDLEKGLRLLAFLEGKDYNQLINEPKFLIDTKHQKWEFLSQRIIDIEVEEPFIEIEGEMYMVQKNFELLSFEQYQHQTEILKESEEDNNYYKNIHLLLAICLIPRDKYSFEKAEILAKKLLKCNMYDLIPAINFFLSKEQSFMIDIHTFLKQVESKKLKQMEVILTQLELSIRHGVGIQHYTLWQTKTLRNLIKFYLYHYKKYLSI